MGAGYFFEGSKKQITIQIKVFAIILPKIEKR